MILGWDRRMEFSKKLQALRKQKGMTQEELARQLFVSRTAVSKWESGRGYPNIESLKAIARVLSVTVDQLLSPNEVLTLAEEDQKKTASHLRDLVFGLLDLCMSLLFCLPLFSMGREGEVRAVSLLGLEGISPYLRVLYIAVVLVTAAVGVLTLALQSSTDVRWRKCKTGASLLPGVLAVLLFVVGRQPYAAVFAFSLLAVKAFLLIRRP